VTALNLDVVGGDAEFRGEHLDDSFVGSTLLGRCRNLDLQGITQPAHDLVS
jgi:hypothetical protein